MVARLQDTAVPLKLVKRVMIANANWAVQPREGAASLSYLHNRHSARRTKTLTNAHDQVIKELNLQLAGGKNYPILTAALGTAAGLASLGAGLIFTAATTTVSIANTIQHVMSWHGKVTKFGMSRK